MDCLEDRHVGFPFQASKHKPDLNIAPRKMY